MKDLSFEVSKHPSLLVLRALFSSEKYIKLGMFVESINK